MGGKEGYWGIVVNLNKYTQGVLINKLKNHGIVGAYISKKPEKEKANSFKLIHWKKLIKETTLQHWEKH